MDERPPFQEDEPEERVEDGAVSSDLVLNLGGFEGPIDVLLTLARDQK
ncbi:MAG: segregation/condensation protein A, partial [Rhodospirillaceae bacterium]|nr:segregation/condensation protein A [Rhodospirillaceae bacterium]